MELEEKDINFEYRLTQMEKQLAEVLTEIKALNENILQSRLNDKDIQNDISNLRDRIADLETDNKELKKKITDLTQAPLNKDATKWRTVIDTLFKTLVTAGIAGLMAYLGIKK